MFHSLSKDTKSSTEFKFGILFRQNVAKNEIFTKELRHNKRRSKKIMFFRSFLILGPLLALQPREPNFLVDSEKTPKCKANGPKVLIYLTLLYFLLH